MLAFATGREVRMLLGSPTTIRHRLDEMYRNDDVVNRLLEGIGGDFEVKELKEVEEETAASAEEASQRPIIRLVDVMLADGVTSRASDIHVEPIEGGVVVRYRIDGVLRQVMKIPRNAGLPLISRIKIMSGLDIADRLRPQDGRARVSRQRRGGRPPRLDPAGLARREGRHPHPEPAGHRAQPGRARAAQGRAGGDPEPPLGEGGHPPRHRPHRLRQDDDALLRDPADPERGRQHRHGRGPGRVPAGREHRPGAGAREGRAHLRLGAALDPAAGPGRGAHRRDPRPGDGADRAPGVAHRPPRALHAPHQRRARTRSRGSWTWAWSRTRSPPRCAASSRSG